MKNNLFITFLLSFTFLLCSNVSYADDNPDSNSLTAGTLGLGGTARVEGGDTSPIDPENPEQLVDPGEGPSTDGALRFDFASSINFGSAKITDSNRVYHAQAQLFHSDTSARGSYIQITDQREGATGWTLQVKQSYQFKNDVIQDVKERELIGAVLSLDKGWANAFNPINPPVVTRDTINLSNIGSYYDVATAAEGCGYGTWLIEFGASEGNKGNQPNSLSPLTDASGAPIIDATYNKQAFKNEAISLKVPDNTKIYPVQYQTELTWLLAELP